MTMNQQRQHAVVRMVALLLLLSIATSAQAQTTSFTYQGRLTDGATAANGNYDLQFALFDSLADGAQVGSTQTASSVSVSAGIFSVSLDFGAAAFPGTNRWLEIRARLTGMPSFTTLSPRQAISSTPYAIRSFNASSADTVTVSGVPAGSSNYVQNATSQQAGANFNISGNGTAGGTVSANVVNATAQFNLGGSRVLTLGTSVDNLFVGDLAGQANPTGGANSFFGKSAGFNNTTGEANSFFGRSAGFTNATGSSNSFFGVQAGRDNLDGFYNSFFGRAAGISNNGHRNSFFGFETGRGNLANENSFFGYEAGTDNQSGGANSFFGTFAGWQNVNGEANTFFGWSAGWRTTGSNNTFVGTSTGSSNIQGTFNTAIGASANVASPNLVNATAIGAFTVVDASNRVQIGRIGVDTVAIGAFASPTSSIPVCINNLGVFVNCASSSLRYKEGVLTWRQGLNVIQGLRPVTFRWKDGHFPDLGLIAEEVAAVEPLLSIRGAKGQIEGVRYDRLNVVLINAIKEQQKQIETLREQNAALNIRLKSVEHYVRKRIRRQRK
jgi:hypothetical protein